MNRTKDKRRKGKKVQKRKTQVGYSGEWSVPVQKNLEVSYTKSVTQFCSDKWKNHVPKMMSLRVSRRRSDSNFGQIRIGRKNSD